MALCPTCSEFIGKALECRSCGWKKKAKRLPPAAKAHILVPPQEGTPFLDPMNAELARKMIEAIKAGPAAIKELTDQIKAEGEQT